MALPHASRLPQQPACWTLQRMKHPEHFRGCLDALFLGARAHVNVQHLTSDTTGEGVPPCKTLTCPYWRTSWLLQDVLCKVVGGSAMTVAEATTIADNALEHSVRTVLASLQAAEILKSTDGRLVQVSGVPQQTLR